MDLKKGGGCSGFGIGWLGKVDSFCSRISRVASISMSTNHVRRLNCENTAK